MEQLLPGGFVNAVVRVGDTVRRPPSPNAGFVHDLTAGTPLAGPGEVVCHNDLSPKNTVYRDRGLGLRPVAFIDWDIAGPGDRLHDVAHVCWQYLPLGPAAGDLDTATRPCGGFVTGALSERCGPTMPG